MPTGGCANSCFSWRQPANTARSPHRQRARNRRKSTSGIPLTIDRRKSGFSLRLHIVSMSSYPAIRRLVLGLGGFKADFAERAKVIGKVLCANGIAIRAEDEGEQVCALVARQLAGIIERHV